MTYELNFIFSICLKNFNKDINISKVIRQIYFHRTDFSKKNFGKMT